MADLNDVIAQFIEEFLTRSGMSAVLIHGRSVRLPTTSGAKGDSSGSVRWRADWKMMRRMYSPSRPVPLQL